MMPNRHTVQATWASASASPRHTADSAVGIRLHDRDIHVSDTMNGHHLIRGLATAAVVSLSALTGCGNSPVSPSSAAPGSHDLTGPRVCAAVSDCHVVAAVDVDGDGSADPVGWRQVSDRSVQIRVRTTTEKLLTAPVDVRLWSGGGAWGGASGVDGRPGAELLVGSTQGAHTPMYTMLTYRAGALVVERSPSPLSPLWQVDAAYGDYLGWWRHTLGDGGVAMTQKVAIRSLGTTRFQGDNVRYVWSADRWTRTATTAASYPTVRSAAVIGGFHVAGLAAFPGLG